jgi:hypothetical protein
MSKNEEREIESTAGEELAQILARKGPRTRAKSTTALLAVLLVLLGVLIGVPIGRASAPPTSGGPGTSESGPPPGGPFGGRPRD